MITDEKWAETEKAFADWKKNQPAQAPQQPRPETNDEGIARYMAMPDDELQALISGKPKSAPLYTKPPEFIGKAIAAAGTLIGSDTLEGIGTDVSDYWTERGKQPMLEGINTFQQDISKVVGPEIQRGMKAIGAEQYADIPAAFVGGMTGTSPEAEVTLPEEPGLGHQLATGVAGLAGMGLSPLARIPAGAVMKAAGRGLIPGVARLAATAPEMPAAISTLGNVGKIASFIAPYEAAKQQAGEGGLDERIGSFAHGLAMGGAIGMGGGLIEKAAGAALPVVARATEKIAKFNEMTPELKAFLKVTGIEVFTPGEKAALKGLEYGKSGLLGAGFGAIEPAETWEDFARNVALGAGTFMGAHGISEASAVAKPYLKGTYEEGKQYLKGVYEDIKSHEKNVQDQGEIARGLGVKLSFNADDVMPPDLRTAPPERGVGLSEGMRLKHELKPWDPESGFANLFGQQIEGAGVVPWAMRQSHLMDIEANIREGRPDLLRQQLEAQQKEAETYDERQRGLLRQQPPERYPVLEGEAPEMPVTRRPYMWEKVEEAAPPDLRTVPEEAPPAPEAPRLRRTVDEETKTRAASYGIEFRGMQEHGDREYPSFNHPTLGFFMLRPGERFDDALQKKLDQFANAGKPFGIDPAKRYNVTETVDDYPVDKTLSGQEMIDTIQKQGMEQFGKYTKLEEAAGKTPEEARAQLDKLKEIYGDDIPEEIRDQFDELRTTAGETGTKKPSLEEQYGSVSDELDKWYAEETEKIKADTANGSNIDPTKRTSKYSDQKYLDEDYRAYKEDPGAYQDSIDEILNRETPVDVDKSHNQLKFIQDMIDLPGPEGTYDESQGGKKTGNTRSSRPKWLQDYVDQSGRKYETVKNAITRLLEGKKTQYDKTDRVIAEELIRASAKDYEKIKDTYERKPKIDPAKIRVGEKVVIDGEEYQRVQDDKEGRLRLKGKTKGYLYPDPFTPLEVDYTGEKRIIKEEETPYGTGRPDRVSDREGEGDEKSGGGRYADRGRAGEGAGGHGGSDLLATGGVGSGPSTEGVGRESEQRGAGEPNLDGTPQSVFSGESAGLETDTNEHQVDYIPKSKGEPSNALIPKFLRGPIQAFMEKITDVVMNVDAFVRSKLKIGSTQELHKYYSAEQVDGIAMTLYQFSQGNAVILADQTGFGKGRQIAAIIRHANLIGKKPVFITASASLYTDIYRDLAATNHKIKPFIMHTQPNVASIYDGDGNVIFKPQGGGEAYRKFLADPEGFMKDYDAIFSSYSQLQQDNIQQDVLSTWGRDNIVILDESHKASGDSASGAYIRDMIGTARNVLYSSATYAKRPDNMGLYFRTSIGKSGIPLDQIIDAIKNLGVAGQQIISNQLAKDGQLMRREMSYKGIDIENRVDIANTERDTKRADTMTSVMRSLYEYDKHDDWQKLLDGIRGEWMRKIRNEYGPSAAQGVKIRVARTPFSQIMHNLSNQMLFALKADSVVQEAIAAIRAGQKPVINFMHTNEAALNFLIENAGLKVGDTMDVTFKEMLKRYLQNTMRYRVTVTFPGKEPQRHKLKLTTGELSYQLSKLFEGIGKEVEKVDTELPLSPVDYIKYRIQTEAAEILGREAKVGELTGRSYFVDYSKATERVVSYTGENITTMKVKQAALGQRTNKEIVARNPIIKGFNDGDLDVLMYNSAGSTGMSAHAAPEFKDQRQRKYIGAQADLNIDTDVQSKGRINRKGQVVPPTYTNLMTNIPAELRPAVILARKMASLNANITANDKSALSMRDIPDMNNLYGDRVVEEWLSKNPDIAHFLDMTPDKLERMEAGSGAIFRRATNRASILSVDMQRMFYDEVEAEYGDLISHLNQIGENKLTAKDYDLRAETLQKHRIFKGTDETNYFSSSAYIEKISAKILKNPHNAAKIRELVEKSLGDKSGPIDFLASMKEKIERTNLEYIADLEKQRDEAEGPKVASLSRLITIAKDHWKTTKQALTGFSDKGVRVGEKLQIGSTYSLPVGKDYSLTGVLIDIRESKTKGGSPAAPSKFRAVFAVTDPIQRYEIPFSRLNELRGVRMTHEGIHPDWDKLTPQEKRETRYVLTGNILGAATKTDKGEIVMFTDNAGKRRNGILLPKSMRNIEENFPPVEGDIPVVSMPKEEYNALKKQIKEIPDFQAEDNTIFERATKAVSDFLIRARGNVSSRAGKVSSEQTERVIGKGISDTFVKNGYVQLRGMEAKNHRDIAQISQILRNPGFETFYYIMAKDGKIVSVTPFTSRIPGMTTIYGKGKEGKEIYELRKRLNKSEANEVWIVHNHPSGDPSASIEDRVMTEKIAKYFPELKGHVIINSGKYAVLNLNRAGQKGIVPSERMLQTTGMRERFLKAQEVAAYQETFPIETDDSFMKASVQNPWLGRRLDNARDIVGLAKGIQVPNAYLPVIFRNAKGRVTGIEQIHVNEIKQDQQFARYLRNRVTEYGAQNVFIAGEKEVIDSDKDLSDSLNMLYVKGKLTDVVQYYPGYGGYLALAKIKSPEVNDRQTFMGEPIVGERVRETAAAEWWDENKADLKKMVPSWGKVKAGTVGLQKTWDGIKRLFFPTTRGPEGKFTGETLGAGIGELAYKRERVKQTLSEWQKIFEKMPKEGVVDFMQAIDVGETHRLPEDLRPVAELIDSLFADRRAELREIGKPLAEVRRGYFPHIWKRGTDIDKILDAMYKRPFEGAKAFRKARSWDDVITGIQMGAEPVSWNPLDLVSIKLYEIDKFVMAHKVLNELKGLSLNELVKEGNRTFLRTSLLDKKEVSEEDKLVKYFRLKEKPGSEWKKINDPYGTVFAPPKVTAWEGFDEMVINSMNEVMKNIGVTHERRTTLGRKYALEHNLPVPEYAKWGRKAGFARGRETWTRFGGPEFVIAHELGHNLDNIYGLQAMFLKYGREMEKVTDLTWENKRKIDPKHKKYVRKWEERLANMISAWVHVPEKFKRVAPGAYNEWVDFLRGHEELKPLLNIERSIVLGTARAEQPTAGPQLVGHYYAKDEVAQVLNNYLSKSIYDSPYVGTPWEAYMNAAGTLNSFQLGVLSMFHAGFTSGEAMVSRSALGIKQLYQVVRGEESIETALKTFASVPLSFVTKAKIGGKLINAYRDPMQATELENEIVHGIVTAGGRIGMEDYLFTKHSKSFKEKWANKEYVGAALRSPLAAVEQMARPIMEWLVPRQKFGVFAELFEEWKKHNAGASYEEYRAGMRQIWNHVDARLGQVVYDRIFANNVAKNVVQGLVRAPGWTGGTLYAIGKTPSDIGKFVKDWMRSKEMPSELPDSVAYTMSLLTIAAVVNGVLTYAFTNKKPEGADFWAFRTGGHDEDGKPERFVLPLYTKDMYAYSQHPGKTLLHKTHPMLALGSDILIRNKDYYGEEVRHRGDPFLDQIGDVMKYGAKAFVPFWMRGAERAYDRGHDPLRMSLPLIGIMPAPMEYTKTKAEKAMGELLEERAPKLARTHAEQERYTFKRKLRRDLLLHGDAEPIRQAIKEDKISATEAKYMFRRGHEAPIERGFEHLNAEDALVVWKKANQSERKLLRKHMVKKLRQLYKYPVKEREELKAGLMAAIRSGSGPILNTEED